MRAFALVALSLVLAAAACGGSPKSGARSGPVTQRRNQPTTVSAGQKHFPAGKATAAQTHAAFLASCRTKSGVTAAACRCQWSQLKSGLSAHDLAQLGIALRAHTRLPHELAQDLRNAESRCKS